MNSISSAPVPTPYARHGNVEKTAALLCCLLFSGLAFVLPTLVREARRDMHSLMEEKVHVSRGGVGASAWYEASNRNRTVRDERLTSAAEPARREPRVVDEPMGESPSVRRRRGRQLDVPGWPTKWSVEALHRVSAAESPARRSGGASRDGHARALHADRRAAG
jgi:hypothetical protein